MQEWRGIIQIQNEPLFMNGARKVATQFHFPSVQSGWHGLEKTCSNPLTTHRANWAKYFDR